MNRFDPVQ